MALTSRRAGYLLLGLFVASGFAGLIYQSVWSHYLGLMLGHAAYAQALVLAIFMGGMALGAWLASRHSLRWRHLILAYALIEVAIGVGGLAFHPVFNAFMHFSTQVVLPSIETPALAHAFQWMSAALLIAPQCVLLGATFPLLSAGFLRLAPRDAGPILGGLYFSNSIGAALGALATAFLILPAIGMPGSVVTAGLINLLVGIAAWLVWRQVGKNPVVSEPEPGHHGVVSDGTAGVDTNGAAGPRRRFLMLMLFAAAITGATSFVYEIGWVRLLNQALGTTVHSFELMLAAFILGLAFGGLWVRRRSMRSVDAVAVAGYAQILMGIAALASIPVFNESFRWVGWLMGMLPRDDAGYAWFSLGSGAIAMLVMFPAAFFAGMTLPLFTLALLRGGHGEASIGRTYAANTLGAILGVFMTVYFLVPWIGVRLSISLAALADVALGLYLLRMVSPGRWTRGVALVGAFALVALAVSLRTGRPDVLTQVSGVFRTGVWRMDESVQVPFLRDGQTATVAISVSRDDQGIGVGRIMTNGKPDAALALNAEDAASADEETMLMAAALPLALHPSPERVAVIGWGSGLTTHTLLGSSRPERVDSIEIERAMYEGASLFGARVHRAYEDPRSHVTFDDARTYFAIGNRRYDVIISEPSNPWVSGVASLFTTEFYSFIHDHLEDGGVLVQWIQTYELDDALLATMTAALLEHFPEIDLYLAGTSDLLFVAYRDARHPPDWNALSAEPLSSELRRVGLGGAQDFNVRRVGGTKSLQNLVRLTGAHPHSDYYPTVSLEAPRARFTLKVASTLLNLPDSGLPVQDLLGEREVVSADAVLTPSRFSRYAGMHQVAVEVRSALMSGTVSPTLREKSADVATVVEELLTISAQPLSDAESIRQWSGKLAVASGFVLGMLPGDEVRDLYESPVWLKGLDEQPQAVTALLRMFASAASREPEPMMRHAMEVLDAPVDVYAPYARENALVIAQLGAIGAGRFALVSELETTKGVGIPASRRLGPMRSWLLAWASR